MGSLLSCPRRSRQPPYQFLLRNLKVSDDTELAFKQVFIKRLYLKNLIDVRRNNHGTKEAFYQHVKRKKLFKTIKKLQLSSMSHKYVPECLKTSKNLKNFRIVTNNAETRIENIALTVKKLPVQVENLFLKVFTCCSTDIKSLCKVAKSIQRLLNLQFFYRAFELQPGTQIETELKSYNQSVSRLKKIKTVFYRVGFNEQPSFQKMMRKGIVHPKINGLETKNWVEQFPGHNILMDFAESDSLDSHLDVFDFDEMTDHQRLTYELLLNDIRKYFESPTDLIEHADRYTIENSEDVNFNFIMQCIMREEIKPFYRFELFPDLKTLKLADEGCRYPLDSFVIDGFSALKKLQKLKISLSFKPLGALSIFQGILTLPLLRKFFLKMPFLKSQDWELLKQFLQKQNNLESLSLLIRDEPSHEAIREQNNHLKTLLSCLQQKSLLKLKVSLWSLTTLSEGLALLNQTNQLNTLKIAIRRSLEEPRENVQGLCDFLKNQRNSLKTMLIRTPVVSEETIYHLFKEVSQLTSLRKLGIAISPASATFDGKSFIRNLQPDPTGFLPRLEHLEDFLLSFCDSALPENDSREWLIKVIGVLTHLKNLRKILINNEWYLSVSMLNSAEKKIADAVLQLRNIREITIDIMDLHSQKLEILENAIKQVNQRQSLKCEIMF